MAENKKSFILYADLIHTVRKMPKGKQAELFMTILEYVNDQNPVVKDLVVSVAFEPIKVQLKRDLKNWEQERVNRSEAGKKGMASRWKMVTKDNSVIPVITPITNITDNVNVTVNDTVTDNVKEESNTLALKNSNLFRQPKIPDFEDVHRAFLSAGGTEEMARLFFDRNEGTGWYLKGSPITNFRNLIPSYVSNWNKNLKNGKSTIADRQKSARADLRARGQDSFNAALREADNRPEV